MEKVLLERDEHYIESRWAESVGACLGSTTCDSGTVYKIHADRAALVRGGQPNPLTGGEW